jgi:hypothetical protein
VNPPAVISVTADHIRDGEPQNVDECPIALALLEQWPGGLRGVHVDTNAIYAWPGAGGELEAKPPAGAVEFINAYDNGDPDYVAPFTFAVEWIDQDGVSL